MSSLDASTRTVRLRLRTGRRRPFSTRLGPRSPRPLHRRVPPHQADEGGDPSSERGGLVTGSSGRSFPCFPDSFRVGPHPRKLPSHIYPSENRASPSPQRWIICMFRPFRSRFILAVLTIGIVVFSLSMGGCGANNPYHLVPGHVSNRFLPAERPASPHPDSGRALEIRQEKNRYRFEPRGGGRISHSKVVQDLLAPIWWTGIDTDPDVCHPAERGAGSRLPGIRNGRIVTAKREGSRTHRAPETPRPADHFYRRAPGGVPHSCCRAGYVSAGRLGEDEYKPVTQNHTPLRQTSRHDGTYLSRTNTFVFSGTVDGTDLLKEASKIELWIEARYFTWT